jgi:hypothetical protein
LAIDLACHIRVPVNNDRYDVIRTPAAYAALNLLALLAGFSVALRKPYDEVHRDVSL